MKQPSAISRQPSAKLLRLFLVGCGLLAVGSCNEIAGPLRPGGYGYTLIATDVVAHDTTIGARDYFAGDAVTDTVDFSWPPSLLPLKIWAEDTIGLRQDMAAGIETWKHVLEYGEFDAELTGDSARADIIVRNAVAPPTAPGLSRMMASGAACEGATDVHVSAPDHTKLWTPIRIYIVPKYLLTDTATTNCLRRVAAHELGHALGLFQHSPDPGDIMAGFPAVDVPSDRDQATVLWVYHQPVDLHPARGADTLFAAPPPPAP